MKRHALTAVLALAVLLLSACGLVIGAPSSPSSDSSQGSSSQEAGGPEAIPFSGEQCYAVAHLGYQEMDSLPLYSPYLEEDSLPVHYVSPGDYYLVIPRYPNMSLALYRNDINSNQPALVYTDPHCRPFIIQCNASDIFEDAVIRLSWEGGQVEFSPFISLEDGSIVVGPQGFNLTHTGPQ